MAYLFCLWEHINCLKLRGGFDCLSFSERNVCRAVDQFQFGTRFHKYEKPILAGAQASQYAKGNTCTSSMSSVIRCNSQRSSNTKREFVWNARSTADESTRAETNLLTSGGQLRK